MMGDVHDLGITNQTLDFMRYDGDISWESRINEGFRLFFLQTKMGMSCGRLR